MSLFGSSFPPAFANQISNTGQIVGEFFGSFGNATFWKNGVATELGGLPGFLSSAANGVNDLGQIVGSSLGSPTGQCCDFHVHAVSWTKSGVIRDLGTLSGDTESSATKINLLGLIIGASGNSFVGEVLSDEPIEVVGRPFVWSERKGMQNLNSLIPSNSGWVLNSARDINVWGQIVGEGTLNGQPHGFLLTPRNPFVF